MVQQEIISEEEFLHNVKRVIKQLGNSYKFGIYTYQDISQEIHVKCWEILPKWNKQLPLFNFLLTAVKHHLINLKRNEFYRSECPCKLCSNKDDGHTEHEDGRYCKKFLSWKSTNLRKANIAFPPSIPDDYDGYSHEDNISNILSNEELQDIIDIKMPVKTRGVYLRMKSGQSVSNVDKQKVLKFLKKLLKDY